VRKPQVCLAGAAAAGPSRHSSAAHPAAAPAAEAVRAAAHIHAQCQVTHNSPRVFQRAIGNAAATLAHSAEQCDTAPVQSTAERARNTSSAGASPSRSRTVTDDETDMSGSASGSPYAPSNADGAPEPGGAAGTSPRTGGASHLATAGAAGSQGMEGGKLGL